MSYATHRLAMSKNCILCNSNDVLRLSHIIPKFVINHLKDSALSAIRSMEKPNIRVQDGIKDYLLCQNCEELFSQFEKKFSEYVFFPIHSHPTFTQQVSYGPWALKFAVSVSWRVLQYYIMKHDLNLPNSLMNTVNEALTVWRDFLTGKIEHPKQFQQHILPVDIIDNHTLNDISPFINRYFTQSIGIDIITNDDTVIVYSKLCKILIFGVVKIEKNVFKGSLIHLNGGHITPKTNYFIPKALLDYLNNEANHVKIRLESMSDNQKEKIRASLYDNIENFNQTLAFKAISKDFEFSGVSAFDNTYLKNK